MSTTEKFGIEVNFLTAATRRLSITTVGGRSGRLTLPACFPPSWRHGPTPINRTRWNGKRLEWLEEQGAPAIAASPATPRKVVSYFVPVNDAAIISKALQARKADRLAVLANQLRDEWTHSGGEATRNVDQIKRKLAAERSVTAQVRDTGNTPPIVGPADASRASQEAGAFFPHHGPHETRVTYLWDGRILAVYGMPSIICSSELPDWAIPPLWYRAGWRLFYPPGRWCGRQRGELSSRPERSIGGSGATIRGPWRCQAPFPAVFQCSLQAVTDTSADLVPLSPNTAGELIVFEFAPQCGPCLPLRRWRWQWRCAPRSSIMRKDPIPEELSGHRQDGTPTAAAHVAFLPLPYVGYERADGRLKGIAVSVPEALGSTARRRCIAP